MKKTIIGLLVAGIIVYCLQIAIFHDPNTTFFYIFQDLAFLPISVALATIIIGGLLDYRDKRERLCKTQMLTSAFFTELGASLMFALVAKTEGIDEVKTVMRTNEIEDSKSLSKVQGLLKEIDLRVKLDEKLYNDCRQMIMARRDSLLILSSNPMLIEHEDFTSMIWEIFHLEDEFRLRGEFKNLSKFDIEHLEEDFTDLLRFILHSWAGNILYTKKEYPNFYGAALSKLLNN